MDEFLRQYGGAIIIAVVVLVLIGAVIGIVNNGEVFQLLIDKFMNSVDVLTTAASTTTP